MRKIIISVLLTVAMLATLCIGAAAAFEIPEEDLPYVCTILYDKINYGTPNVDGKLDERYAESFQARTGSLPNYGESDSTASATVYILWDEAYFYFCTVVNDTNIQSQSEDWIEEHIGNPGGPWHNECVELHIAWNGADDDRTTAQKWGCDAFGYALYTNYGRTYYEGYEGAYARASVDQDNNTYTLEIAIPNAEGLLEGDAIGFELQLNDLIDFAGNNGSARVASFFGYQHPWDFVYELENDGKFAPVIVPTEPQTEAPTQEATEAPTQKTTEAPTQEATEAPTQKTTEAPTQAPTDNVDDNKGASPVIWIVILALVIIVVAVLAIVFSKKKKA